LRLKVSFFFARSPIILPPISPSISYPNTPTTHIIGILGGEIGG